jgi:metal-responsive CopG/Arc/MetJ family transcriptional regulator
MGAKGARTRSRACRDALRQFLIDEKQVIIIGGLRQTLEARILELECRDREILELRHELGHHFVEAAEGCPACEEIP